jgi:serine/threonine protein kinase
LGLVSLLPPLLTPLPPLLPRPPPPTPRDLKPEHILLAPEGLRIADFSTAAWLPNAPVSPPPIPPDVRKRSTELRRSIEAYHARRTASLTQQQMQQQAAGAVSELEPVLAPTANAAALLEPRLPHKDVLNHRTGSIEYAAPEMLSKPTAAEVFHLVGGLRAVAAVARVGHTAPGPAEAADLLGLGFAISRLPTPHAASAGACRRAAKT